MSILVSKRLSALRTASMVIAAMALSACSGGLIPEEGTDPYEGFNRRTHSFNKGLDRAVLSPLARGYEFAVPETIKHVVNNEVRYAQLPVSLANSVLQGDVSRAGDTAARIFVNTTIGGLGLLDPASDFGIPEHGEDFGQTLAVWGVPSGPYVELPFLGPSTARDSVSRVVDNFTSPLTYIGSGTTTTLFKVAETPVRIVDTRHRFRPLIDEVLYETDDSYSVVRNTYLQRRRNAILNGQVTEDTLPDIDQAEPF